MMRLTKESISDFISSNDGRFICDKGELWENQVGKMNGLLEFPIKFNPSKLYFNDDLGKRTCFSMIKNLLNPQRLKTECNMVVEMGFKLPQPKEGANYEAFLYSFKHGLFNSNVRRYASQLSIIRTVDLGQRFSVCEIGAGYGGFAELFYLNNKNLNNYYIIDLFETLAISMKYLLKRTDKKLFAVERMEDLKGFNEDNSIIFIPSTLAESVLNLKDIKLFVNSSSLLEMPEKEIRRYFNILNSFKGVYFYNYNVVSMNGNKYSKLPYGEGWKTVYDRTITIDGVLRNMRETIMRKE